MQTQVPAGLPPHTALRMMDSQPQGGVSGGSPATGCSAAGIDGCGGTRRVWPRGVSDPQAVASVQRRKVDTETSDPGERTQSAADKDSASRAYQDDRTLFDMGGKVAVGDKRARLARAALQAAWLAE